ncbi:MAG TPA: triose-phosphate isomerase, partial [Geobacteraceae bacterium]
LREQVTDGLSDIAAAELERVIVAYEPVWAIGTGRTASDAQAQEAHAFTRSLLGELYDGETAAKTRILYGGSVKPENVKGLMAQQDIDGALVGGASLKADSFAAIVNFGN